MGIGEAELTPVAIDFAAEAHLIILGQGECGKTSALRTLCSEIVRTNTADAAQLFIVDFRRTLLGVVESEHLRGTYRRRRHLHRNWKRWCNDSRARIPGADVTQQQLRTRSWWSGPEIYIVIDDYDLVAPPTGGNPLAPLA